MSGLPDIISEPWYTRWTRWRQTSQREAAAAEQGLLKLLSTPLAVHNVKVGPGKQDFLHTILGGGAAIAATTATEPQANATESCSYTSFNSPGKPAAQLAAQPTSSVPSPPASSAAAAAAKPAMVLMPGYGAGTGFYFKNLEGLAASFRLYAVDWLGTALSGRPRYQAQNQQQAEAFFLDSLKAWKQEVGLAGEPVILVGHSLGGYLAAAYALKHPEDIKHLVLVCPAGVPKAPEDWQRNTLGGVQGWRSQAFRAAMWAWEAGVTPHALVRTLGPWGPRLCEGYVTNRFSHHGPGMTPQEIHWFKQYFYHSVAAPGSGEYALRHLLAPGAWAHEPLVQRLQDLKVPVTFLYGKEDWMRPQHAVELVEQLKASRAPQVPGDLHVEVVADSGHFVFMDRPETFNAALRHAVRAHLTPPPPGPPADAVTEQAHSTTWELQVEPGKPVVTGNYIAARRPPAKGADRSAASAYEASLKTQGGTPQAVEATASSAQA